MTKTLMRLVWAKMMILMIDWNDINIGCLWRGVTLQTAIFSICLSHRKTILGFGNG